MQMCRRVKKIAVGKGSVEDLRVLDELTEVINNTALCGLGSSSTVPVVSCMKNFKSAFLSHIDGDFCPVCGANGGEA